MGATNRPFDLDEAIIRRMPRRILVDLANEEDRREILQIHLRDENLAEDVSIEDIAPGDWTETVHRPDILPKLDRLHKKPGYEPL